MSLGHRLKQVVQHIRDTLPEGKGLPDVPLFLDTIDTFLTAPAVPEPETASSR